LRPWLRFWLIVTAAAWAGQASLIVTLDWLQRHHSDVLVWAWPRLAAGAQVVLLASGAALDSFLIARAIQARRARRLDVAPFPEEA